MMPARIASIRSQDEKIVKRPSADALGRPIPLRRPGSILFFLASALLALAGCRQISVHRAPSGDCPVVGPTARAELERAGLKGDFALHPREVFAQFEAEAAARPAPEKLLALGEMAYRIGQRDGTKVGGEAVGWYRDAAAYAHFALTAPGASGEIAAEATDLHNRALGRCLRLAYARADRDIARERLAGANILLGTIDPAIAPDQFDALLPAAEYSVWGLTRHGRAGLGAPLIAERKLSEKHLRAGQDRFYGESQVMPLTAVIQPEGSPLGGDWKRRPVRIMVLDPVMQASIPWMPRGVPLAADFTAPLAYQTEHMDSTTFQWGGLVNPDRVEPLTNIYMIHPHRPGKIPVLFMHGLFSSPATWIEMFNELRSDPLIRDRYEFWFAYYPSGHPFLYSTAHLRAALHELHRTLDPSGSDPAIKNTVVVGHSMGGLIGRTMIQSSGMDLWNAYLTRQPGQVRVPPDVGDHLRDVLFFEPEPTFRRAVFIATPHHGSNVANRFLGNLAKALTRPSPLIERARRIMIELNGPEIFQPEYRLRPLSSIDNLQWESPILRALRRLPMSPSVPYHSIIANISLFPNKPATWTDSVVQYESAHIDGAASELIVRSNHGCTGKPETIAEVRRILLLHLGIDQAAAAAAPCPAGCPPR
jgi:hypothetical protein